MTYRDRQRVSDILAAVEAIRSHRYFDTSHAILQATVDNDLPELEQAVRRLARSLADENEGPTSPAV